jgi:hypothetical protein
MISTCGMALVKTKGYPFLLFRSARQAIFRAQETLIFYKTSFKNCTQLNMKLILTNLFVFLSCLLMAQTFNLGSQITNGVTTGGCAASCNPTWCSPTGTGNHTPATCTSNITVPAGSYMSLVITTNNCNTDSGLDNGDFVRVNGVTVVTGASNLIVNYTGCFFNNGSSSLSVPITLIANRRDETINVVATVSTTPCTSPVNLPVALYSVFGFATDNNCVLNFATASESNNSHFEIERSVDGSNFKKIGEVKGAGTTSDEQNYSFVDETPQKGMNYYRLKQVDYDGATEYSKVISVRFGNARSLSVVPTLVYDQINVDLNEMDEQTGEWQIFDLTGRQVMAGSIESDQSNFVADMSALTEGTYILRVQIGDELLTEKVQKL